MDINDSLSKLTPLKPGESLFKQLTATRVNAIQEMIRALARGDNIATGPKVRKKTGAGWITLDFDGDDGGNRSSTTMPFRLRIVARTPPEPGQYAVEILDGKVNNEWPDVGTNAMGVTGSRNLDIANIENSNIFIRVMFNALTNKIQRLDIYERPNETYPTNKITALVSGVDPVPGACDDVDSPTANPPAGYGSLYIMLGFTYLKPPPPGSPPGTAATPQAFNLRLGNQNFEFIYGSFNGLPGLLPVDVSSGWTVIPDDLPPPP